MGREIERDVRQRLAQEHSLTLTLFREFDQIHIGDPRSANAVIDLAVTEQIDAASALGTGKAVTHR